MVENIDFVVCQICLEKKKRLTSQHFKLHNMTVEEYKNKFPDSKLICEKTRSSYSKGASDYLSKKSKEELTRISKLRHNKWKDKYNNYSEQEMLDYKNKLSIGVKNGIQKKIQNNYEKFIEENKTKSEVRKNLFKKDPIKMKQICRKGAYNLWEKLTDEQKRQKINKMVNFNMDRFKNLSDEEKLKIMKNNFSGKKIIKCINGILMNFRSKFEILIFEFLISKNINVKYEPFILNTNTKYQKYHIIDFYLCDYNMIIEAKSLYHRKLSKDEIIEDVNLKKEFAESLGYKYNIIWYGKKDFILDQLQNIIKIL